MVSRRHFWKKLLLFIFLAFICLVFFHHFKLGKNEKRLIVFINSEPYSSDPYEFNYFDNRPFSGAVQVTLFSAYKDSKLSPVLVDEWKSLDSDRVWKFKIRKDIAFSDGRLITPLDIKNSLKRVFVLSNKNKSNQPLLENIKGALDLKKMSDEAVGLTSDENSVTLILKDSDSQLLEKLSFGLYAIVSPKNYNSINGVWQKNADVFSGPYIVKEKNTHFIDLVLRENYPAELHSGNAFEQIRITWDSKLKDSADLISSHGGLDEFYREGFQFYGNTNSFLSYLRVYGWENKGSIFFKRSNRKCIRDALYKELNKSMVRPVYSIYPLILPGVEEFDLTNKRDCNKFYNQKITVRLIKNVSVKKFSAINNALMKVLHDLNLNVETAEFKNVEETKVLAGVYGKLRKPRIDLALLSTDIGNEDPRYVTRFMFSKDGIFLPDPTKKIDSIIKKHEFSLNRVNEVIFDDSIIWPIFHYSLGFEIKKNKIDLSRYNHQWPLSELQWIGAK